MTDGSDPTLRPAPLPEDVDRALRPQMLDEFVGQAEARANLRVFIQSARQRGEAMDHTLFHGPPGLGKTTLAQIMARELGVGFRMTSGPVLAICGECGTGEEYDGTPLLSGLAAISENSSFNATRHIVEVNGRCDGCSTRTPSNLLDRKAL